jgi:hypothetical protein
LRPSRKAEGSSKKEIYKKEQSMSREKPSVPKSPPLLCRHLQRRIPAKFLLPSGGPPVALTGVPRARLAWAAGFDVCEFSPIEGLHHPNFTMARLVYKRIGYVWLSRGGA